MEKISVIIPTLNKKNIILQYLIYQFEEDKAVSEIIIINNTTKPLSPALSGKKLKIYTPETNLYVNGSWNIGVSAAENDIFLIINDDIICDKYLCSSILKTKIFDDDKTGLIGLNNLFIKQYSPNNLNFADFFNLNNDNIYDNIKIVEMSKITLTEFWGSAIFGRKKNYFIIPEYLKIIYGDNFLLYKNAKKGNKNYMISNVYFNHVSSLTSNRNEFIPILKQDLNNWNKYYRPKVKELQIKNQ